MIEMDIRPTDMLLAIFVVSLTIVNIASFQNGLFANYGIGYRTEIQNFTSKVEIFVNTTAQKTKETRESDSWLHLPFEVLTGAMSAVQFMFTLPNLIGTMATAIITPLGFPQIVNQIISGIVTLAVVASAIYVFTKVKI